MLRITKGPAPACIAVLKCTSGADWGSVSGEEKAAMRDAAMAEQGGLCAYCMRRVRGEWDEKGIIDLTIEHWAARGGGADPFHWPDMLGVCSGKTGNDEHCDRSRGSRPLQVHPARDDVEALVRYLGDGAIEMDAPVSKGKIKRNGHGADLEILNLNAFRLKQSRQQISDAVVRRAADADATELRAMIASWEGRDADGQRPAYAGVALYFLRRGLKRQEARSRRIRGVARS